MCASIYSFFLYTFFLFLLLSHLLRPCSDPPSFFPSDLLFLTSAVIFSPFLIPLSFFLDIFPFLISLCTFVASSFLLHPYPLLIFSNKGLFRVRSLHRRLSSDLQGNVSPATTVRVVMGTLFSTTALIAASVSPGM